jgi:hypothetical protein
VDHQQEIQMQEKEARPSSVGQRAKTLLALPVLCVLLAGIWVSQRIAYSNVAESDLRSLVDAINHSKRAPSNVVASTSLLSPNAKLELWMIEGRNSAWRDTQIPKYLSVIFELDMGSGQPSIMVKVDCHPCCIASPRHFEPIDVLGGSDPDCSTSGGEIIFSIPPSADSSGSDTLKEMRVGFKQIGSCGRVAYDQRDMRRDNCFWREKLQEALQQLKSNPQNLNATKETLRLAELEPKRRRQPDDQPLITTFLDPGNAGGEREKLFTGTADDVAFMREARSVLSDFYTLRDEESARAFSTLILAVACAEPELHENDAEWQDYLIQ